MFSLLLPELTLFCGALFILLTDAFLRKRFADIFYASHLLALVFCSLAMVFAIQNFTRIDVGFGGMFSLGTFTSSVKIVALLLLIIVVLISLDFVWSIKKISAEFLALLMIATVGGMVLVSANDFLIFYLGLELQALSLYLLAAIDRDSEPAHHLYLQQPSEQHSRASASHCMSEYASGADLSNAAHMTSCSEMVSGFSAKSSEAGMKYFILGCLASGLLLFGISLIYGYSGTINFEALNELYHGYAVEKNVTPVAVMFGFVLVITAMFFKTSAAPFHMWTPDVYEGSTPIVTTFFATVVKFIAVMVFLRLSTTVLLGWQGIGKIFATVGLLSISIGSFGAIFQKNIKRLLAYSSIAHVGFVMLAIAAFGREATAACVLYMVIYALISVGSFGFLNLMRGETEEKTFEISSLSGLSKTNPVMAFSLAALMLSTAGIPPLAGFFSKFYVLAFAIAYGWLNFAIIAIILSAVAAYYYLRIVKVMYFDEPNGVMQLENISNLKVIIFAAALMNIVLIILLDPLIVLIKSIL
ncbi:MAG: NADH-quinone oxidoreductase subunit N [Alphaproteobacteria bacterium]|nr:NADH-quinone oxidoreductase subunit N [Alphaproteobacteria bacterium]